MIKTRRTFLATLLTTSLTLGFSHSVFAEAPVVDDSENFELFEQQAANKAPATFKETRLASNTDNLDTPLAHEDNHNAMTQTSDSTTLLNTIQGLQQDIQELRGQLEVQAHELKRLQQQQVEFYKDLDARVRGEKSVSQQNLTQPTELNTLSQNNPPATQNQNPSIQPTTSVATNSVVKTAVEKDEKSAYMAAYALINDKQFDDALPAMEGFIAHYPEGGYTANAHYWSGELYMVRKNYPEAIKHFETVLQKFPSSSKSSACLLKVGYALAASGEINEAKQKLQRVIQQYPDTHAAQLALAKLDSLGHP